MSNTAELDYAPELIEAAIECGIELSSIEDAYVGEYKDDEDFAYEQADMCGLIDQGANWPNNCIDWEYAARELMFDYISSNGYYFSIA
jgi:antirestriction protein